MKLSTLPKLAAFSFIVALASACSSAPETESGNGKEGDGPVTETSKTSARTGETECRNGVGHCQAGQHCDSHGFTCETGCVTENNCPAGQACSADGSCVGGAAPQSSSCTRMAGFDGQCATEFNTTLRKAYRCDAGNEPPHIVCQPTANQAKYPGGVCCPF
jgi:hypothetical protein